MSTTRPRRSASPWPRHWPAHRAGHSTAQIDAVRQAFHVIYRQGLALPDALTRLEQELGQVEVVAELITFIRRSTRGINIATHVRMEAA